jgi:hypothetical protein
MALSLKKITAEAEEKRIPGKFYESLRDADVIPLPESVLIKNDNTLDKYIFEPVLTSSINKMISTLTSFKPNLSPVKEVEGKEELYDYGGGSRDSKIEVDKYLFIVILFMHGGYAIDNTKTPVTSITKRNAPLIKPGNKFDGYESLTICGAAPPSQINIGSPNLLNDTYHDIVMQNLSRFSELLTEKLSEVEVPVSTPLSAPGPVEPSPQLHKSSSSRLRKHTSRPYRRAKSVSYFKKGGGPKKLVKIKPIIKEPQPQPQPQTTTTTDADAITLVSSRSRSTIGSRLSKSSRFPKIVSSIKKVSYGIKNRLFSLVKGCVKMVMNNFKVGYAFFDLSDERYNIIQKNVVTAIICMSQHGALKINDDLFDAFSYALFWGLREQDHRYFSEYCKHAVSQSEPGSYSHSCRIYALANAYERFHCIRTIVKEGRYNANHVEKTYSYHPVNDIDVPLGVRIYGYNMVSAKNDKGEISVKSETRYIDIGLDEIFAGKSPDPMLGGQYGITLSEISLFISNKINQLYFGGNPEKKRVSIIDITCSSFFKAQSEIPDIPTSIGMGGRKIRSGQSKTKRRSRRNERNNSKIRNRKITRRTRRTRKNRKK